MAKNSSVKDSSAKNIKATDGNSAKFFGCHRLSFFDKDKMILDDISFETGETEILSIIGPNGGGKTTLIRILVGLIAPTSGRVIKPKGLRLGYIPQSVSFNNLLPMRVKNFLHMSPYYNASVFSRVAEQLNLDSLLKTSLQDLSGGQTQLVLLARALLNSPQLLILDEPDRSLDINARIHFYELLRNYTKENRCALILVSHDLHLVMASTDRVLCLNQHLCCSGTPQEINNNHAYKNLFGDKVGRHFAIYKHRHTHSHF